MHPMLPLGVRKLVSVSGADDRVVATGAVVEDRDDVVPPELQAARATRAIAARAEVSLVTERCARRAWFAGLPRRRGSRAPGPCLAALRVAGSPRRARHPTRRRSGPR